MSIWPSTEVELPTTPQLIIRGGSPQLERLASLEPVLVASDGTEAPLLVALQPGYRMTQAILIAQRSFAPGTTVRMRLDGNYGQRGKTWRISETDPSAPTWTSAPVVGQGEHELWGCGPVAGVPVTLEYASEAPVRVRVRLWRDDDEEASPTVFDLLPRPTESGSEVYVGHGMCSGAFSPPLRPSFRFSLSLVSLSGEEVPTPGGSLTVDL